MVEEGVFNGSLSQMDGYPLFFFEGLFCEISINFLVRKDSDIRYTEVARSQLEISLSSRSLLAEACFSLAVRNSNIGGDWH